ncbi:MAG: sulfate permease [Bacteroidales bacterium]|nr:sulfate permease [Bacteroidales bacterium]
MNVFQFKPALFSSLKDYSKEKFFADLMSGIIVGIVALPLAIAFGIASGVSPQQGLITAVIGGFIVSFFGGSKVQIGGPTGAFIVIVYGIIQQYGEKGLIIATLMAGVLLILLGVFKLGTIIKFIPYPIIVGFTSGIALTIFATQIKDLFGLQMESVPADFISKWGAYAENISSLDLPSVFVGIGSILIIALTPKFSKKIPGSLVAIIFMTLLVYILKNYAGITSIETIGDRYTIQASLPQAQVPDLSWVIIKGLLPAAFTIAVLGAIESLLSATVADGVIGEKHNSNQELIGQGLANLFTPLFGGIPATGAIARTMTNINNGGRTPVAGIIHAIVLLLILLCLGSLTSLIPMSCLAGVLVIVSYNMSEWRTFRSLMKNPKSDISVLLTTFFLTVIFDLTVAIEFGLILACLLFMRRVAETTRISVSTDELDLSEDSDLSLNQEKLTIPDGVEVYEIDGPYFFGIANKFEDQMAQMGDKPKVRIIRMRKVPFIDSTGIHNLASLCRMAKKGKTRIVLSGVKPNVHQVLEKAGFYELLGKENICSNIDEALIMAKTIIDQLNKSTNHKPEIK